MANPKPSPDPSTEPRLSAAGERNNRIPGSTSGDRPKARSFITTNQGTLVLGGSAFTHHLWRTAGKAPSKAALS